MVVGPLKNDHKKRPFMTKDKLLSFRELVH